MIATPPRRNLLPRCALPLGEVASEGRRVSLTVARSLALAIASLAVLLVAPIPAADAQQPRLAAPSRADSLLAQGRLAAAEHALYAAADAKPRDPSARGARGTRWQIDACAAIIRVDHP